MLTRSSTGWDWHTFGGADHRAFVKNECERLESEGRGPVNPKELEQGICDRYIQRDRLDDQLGDVVDEVLKSMGGEVK